MRIVPALLVLVGSCLSGSLARAQGQVPSDLPLFIETFDTLTSGRVSSERRVGSLSSTQWQFWESWQAEDASSHRFDLSEPGLWARERIAKLAEGLYAVDLGHGTALGMRYNGSVTFHLRGLPHLEMAKPAWMQFRLYVAKSAAVTRVNVRAWDGQAFKTIEAGRYIEDAPAREDDGFAVINASFPLPLFPCGHTAHCSPSALEFHVESLGSPGFVALDDVAIVPDRPKTVIPTIVTGEVAISDFLREALVREFRQTRKYFVVSCDADVREEDTARKRVRDLALTLEESGDRGVILSRLAAAGCRLPPMSSLYAARLAVHVDPRSQRREVILTLRDLDPQGGASKTVGVSERDDEHLSWRDLVGRAVSSMENDRSWEIVFGVTMAGRSVKIDVRASDAKGTGETPSLNWRVFYCRDVARFCAVAVEEASRRWKRCLGLAGGASPSFDIARAIEQCMPSTFALQDTGVGTTTWRKGETEIADEPRPWADPNGNYPPGTYLVLAVAGDAGNLVAGVNKFLVTDITHASIAVGAGYLLGAGPFRGVLGMTALLSPHRYVEVGLDAHYAPFTKSTSEYFVGIRAQGVFNFRGGDVPLFGALSISPGYHPSASGEFPVALVILNSIEFGDRPLGTGVGFGNYFRLGVSSGIMLVPNESFRMMGTGYLSKSLWLASFNAPRHCPSPLRSQPSTFCPTVKGCGDRTGGPNAIAPPSQERCAFCATLFDTDRGEGMQWFDFDDGGVLELPDYLTPPGMALELRVRRLGEDSTTAEWLLQDGRRLVSVEIGIG